MSLVIAWTVTVLMVVMLVQFVFYIVSLRRLPTDERPSTATYDRFGNFIGMQENPDYHENPGEHDEEDRALSRPHPLS